MIRRGVLVLLLVAGVAALPAVAQETASAKVSYLTSLSVYVDAGSDQGLSVGDRIEVVRGEEVVAELEVTELSNHRAVCTVVESRVELQVGDGVRFQPAPAVAAAPRQEPNSDRGTRGDGIHGRVGVYFLAASNGGAGNTEYSQPGIDLRIDGRRIAGSGFSLAVDARARRTSQTLANGETVQENQNRLYRAALAWQGARSPWSFALGRQISPNLSMVSTFDGISAGYNRPRWSTGLFTGTQPDGEDYGFSSDVREHGFYFQYRNKPQAQRNWSVTSGLIASYLESEINREFLFVQGRVSGERLSLFATTEIDVNRGWKEEAGEDSLSLTSGFVSLHYRASKVVTLRGGFDDRRSVRLYRDRETPETEFDDAYRQGGWAGIGLRFKKRYSASLDARSNRGGTAGTADSYTGTFRVGRLTKANLAFRLRSTYYANDRQEGWLNSLGAGVDLGRSVHAELYGGVRDETNLVNPAFDDQMVWYGLDIDVYLGQRWFLLLSAEQTSGDFEDVTQYYTRLSYRF